jgi:hypothetical protein
MKKGNVELMQTARELGDIHRGIVGETRQATASLKSESSELRKEAANSKHVFDRGKRVLFCAILLFGLSTGLVLEQTAALATGMPHLLLVTKIEASGDDM